MLNRDPNMASNMAQAAATAGSASKCIADCWAMSLIVPMAVKAIIELGIPDILAKAEGGKPLSAPEIVAKLPTKGRPGPNSSINLTRLMRPLVQEGLFSETLNDQEQPAYGLTEISKFCVKDHGIVPTFGVMFHQTFLGALCRLHEVILDEEKVPFAVEAGMSFYECVETNPQFRVLFYNAMGGLLQPQLKHVVDGLQQTGWLEGVKTFVDVGGGEGAVAGRVVAHNPHIKGINFDRPPVLENAPEWKGVQHVEGDFFKAVPSGDATFMKLIMHNYNDEQCIKILSNCFEALPKGGRVIIAENILINSDNSPKATFNALLDVTMLGLFEGGRERSEAQYHEILSAAGFSNISAHLNLTGIDLMQGIKE